MNIDEIIYYSKEAYAWADDCNDIIQMVVNIQIQELIEEVSLIRNKTSLEKVSILECKLKEKIKVYLKTYNEEELAIVLINLKAHFRMRISNPQIRKDDYEEANRHSEVLYIISILLEIKNNEFKNRSLINGSKNLAIVFRLAYYFNVLEDNKEWYEFLLKDNENIQVNNLGCFFKEAYFYSNKYNVYMDSLLTCSNNYIPEELEVSNKKLNDFLYESGLHKDNIIDNVSDILVEELNFSIKDLNYFCYCGLKGRIDIRDRQEKDFIIITTKDKYYRKLKEELSMNKQGYENILKMFSFNKIDKSKLNDNKYVELRNIYEIEDKIIYNPIDMEYNISCLEKFSIRKHFEDYFLYNFKEVEKNIQKKLNINSNKISTYLSYILAEILYDNGYKVPIKNSIPMAEIKSIIINKDGQTTNILKNKQKDYGDIDVLALNNKTKEIFNIEFKYFAPLINLDSINDKFKEKDRKKYVDKAIEREEIIKNNLNEVVQFLKGKKMGNIK